MPEAPRPPGPHRVPLLRLGLGHQKGGLQLWAVLGQPPGGCVVGVTCPIFIGPGGLQDPALPEGLEALLGGQTQNEAGYGGGQDGYGPTLLTVGDLTSSSLCFCV